MPCRTSSNAVAVDQTNFWDSDGIHWDTHRIGWAIAGGCAALTTIISAISVFQHARNYTVPAQQRQILRILYMPPVYAVISFLSYRFYHDYTYYSFIENAYEAVTLSAFLLLIIDYVASTATGHSTDRALERKDKTPLPLPFCCWRYRPTKAYFMYAVKWSVLQYVIIRPVASIAGMICERFDILCEADGLNIKYADIYLEAVDFVSISIALYGLLLFYGLMHEELADKRPLAKFLSIKLIVMFTFYQTFVIKALNGKIHATSYWTTTNIADGLNALAICIEMVFFSALMWWAYPAKEYRIKEGTTTTSIWRPLWDSINYTDFIIEILGSLKFFFCGKPAAHSNRDSLSTSIVITTSSSGTNANGGALKVRPKLNFGQAFGVSPIPGGARPMMMENNPSHLA